MNEQKPPASRRWLTPVALGAVGERRRHHDPCVQRDVRYDGTRRPRWDA